MKEMQAHRRSGSVGSVVEQREAACPPTKVGHATGASIEVGFVNMGGDDDTQHEQGRQ